MKLPIKAFLKNSDSDLWSILMEFSLFHRLMALKGIGPTFYFYSPLHHLKIYIRERDGRIIAGYIIVLGILLRLVPYLHNRSLWLDESWLAYNILNKSFSQLWGFLDYKQIAPVGFLTVEKLLIVAFGQSEYTLRAFPLMAGILSLFLFYGIARRILTYRGLIIALGLFAISGPLIRYSSELKQYSSDVVIALGIFLLGLICIEKESKFIISLFLLSIMGAIFIWFSHPAIFSLAGVGISSTLYYSQAQQWHRVAWLSLPAGFWLSSFAINYFMSLRDLSQHSPMVKAWSNSTAFMPIMPLSVDDLEWYLNSFFEMFVNPGGLPFYGLAAFCFTIGWVSTFSEKRFACYFFTLPILFTLFASGLHMYPFHGRLILFLVPAILIFIGEGVDQIMTWTKPAGRITGVALCILLFLFPTHMAMSNLVNPARLEREEVRPIMAYLSQHYKHGDKLYLYHSSWGAFDFYAKQFGLKDVQFQPGVSSKKNWDKYISDLKRLQGNDRVWVLFSHVHKNDGANEESFFLHVLNGMGKQIDAIKRTGASLYLYDLQSNSHSAEVPGL